MWFEYQGYLVKVKLLDTSAPVRGIGRKKGYWSEYFHSYLSHATWPPDIGKVDLSVFTPLQKRILAFALSNLPPGKVITYGGLARALGTHPRAVASALRANDVPIVLPCHRVVGYNSIGGFSAGLKWKRFLLELEGVRID